MDIKEQFFRDGFVHLNINVTPGALEDLANQLGKPLKVSKHTLEGSRIIQRISDDALLKGYDIPWHNDVSYSQGDFHGAMLAYVYDETNTSTEFADCQKAYEELSPDIRDKLEDAVGKFVVPDYLIDHFGDAQYKLIERNTRYAKLICTHPITGKKSLYISPETIRGINVDNLVKHCEQFTFTHHWKPGDVIIWDNRRMMHRRPAFEGKREMWRIGFNYDQG